MMRILLPLSFVLIFPGAGCQGPSTGASTDPGTTQAIRPFDAGDARMGDSLIKAMGPLAGKVVADLYADDGYYTWKLLGAGARVLAMEDDPAQAAALEARKKSEGIGDDRLLVRLVPAGTVGLLPGEADLALVTREYSTLGDRGAWIKELMAGIKEPHLFYLVNYLPVPSPSGPPLSQRMEFDRVADELMTFGVDDVGILYKTLPDRYILFGSKPPVFESPDTDQVAPPSN
ncbi:MAG TPA: hypothetical protein PLV70_08235 [Flavobacteriales bacterium]|nr:hypothetical protein [Flavobacteriales bacterium]HRN36034.1 hypothetical protein [Flavobacteriales bacterium]HRO38680.1 hypothetical protein [Flavobacteriales bacterium]HRP82214.1 hypothetical protein [Flavobacteriales bacterium]HRQ85082.1 hypothetical protein [Flavobacteriales bacterium]